MKSFAEAGAQLERLVGGSQFTQTLIEVEAGDDGRVEFSLVEVSELVESIEVTQIDIRNKVIGVINETFREELSAEMLGLEQVPFGAEFPAREILILELE